MSEIKQLPTLAEIAKLWKQMDCPCTPSYAHGCWTGLICGGQAFSPKSWVDIVTEQPEAWSKAAPEVAHLLLQLAEITVVQLSDPDYILQLLLPDDEEPLEERVAALAQWCQGFMLGFEKQAAAYPRPALSEQAKEAVTDLEEMTHLSTVLHDPEEEENDWMEVVEYVRMAVLLLHTEMLYARTHSSENPHTLH